MTADSPVASLPLISKAFSPIPLLTCRGAPGSRAPRLRQHPSPALPSCFSSAQRLSVLPSSFAAAIKLQPQNFYFPEFSEGRKSQTFSPFFYLPSTIFREVILGIRASFLSGSGARPRRAVLTSSSARTLSSSPDNPAGSAMGQIPVRSRCCWSYTHAVAPSSDRPRPLAAGCPAYSQ